MRYPILFGHAYCFYFYACTSCNTQFSGLDSCDRLLIRAFSAGSPAVKNNAISLMLRENRFETMDYVYVHSDFINAKLTLTFTMCYLGFILTCQPNAYFQVIHQSGHNHHKWL